MTHNLSSADINILSREARNFCYIKKRRYGYHFNTQILIRLAFFERLDVL